MMGRLESQTSPDYDAVMVGKRLLCQNTVSVSTDSFLYQEF